MTSTSSEMISLRSWIETEAKRRPPPGSRSNGNSSNNNNSCIKESIIRRTTIAFGIVELLKRRANINDSSSSSTPNNNSETIQQLEEEIQLDNFTVSVTTEPTNHQRPWDDIHGVTMISSGLLVTIEEPSYLSCLLVGEECEAAQMGRYLEVELMTSLQNNNGKTTTSTAAESAAGATKLPAKVHDRNHNNGEAEEIIKNRRHYLFARLLYELFVHEQFPDDVDNDVVLNNNNKRRSGGDGALSNNEGTKAASSPKRAKKSLMLSRAKGDFDHNNNRSGSTSPCCSISTSIQLPAISRMKALGIPASICLMTQNLLECASFVENSVADTASVGGDSKATQQAVVNNAYPSLNVLSKDLHLLLLDPHRFLFDKEHNNENMQLCYRKDKLYGRDKEETLITDAFCRVSRGKSEAFFIGGYSGSGKSKLVENLRERVDAVGGYYLKHKFDSEGRPLYGIISACNQLCLMIKERNTPKDVAETATKLRDEFGGDFGLLIRLLPNVGVLYPDSIDPMGAEKEGDKSETNVRSVCFMMLRFVRVVSSPSRPVMLFLDDIQWADSTALDLIHTIVSDTMGSCMFFVGTYRDNEVRERSHPIFGFIKKLEASCVPMTQVTLTGLDQEDLNTMISDALCLYPRICKPLSNIVFQKTKGNPFFLLEFMQSLLDRGLLWYNLHQKRWVWSEDIIRSEKITDNVLHLLSSKMNGLRGNVQTLLKVMASFGTRTDELVIDHLSESPHYSDIGDGLKRSIIDGYVEKDGETQIKFVHDKVREAAYNLIPDSEKIQFHYNLGMMLYSICKKKDCVEKSIFLIASQINHGKHIVLRNDELLVIEVMDLNMIAGKKALDGCDHKTAYSYLSVALSMLPEGHWKRDYDTSLRLNFLLASAAYSSNKYDEAELVLQRIFVRARCIEDKLPSYFLFTTILQARGKVNEAYDACSTILTQLGEEIPNLITPASAQAMVVETLKLYEEVYTDEWLKQSKMEDKIAVAKFYTNFVTAAYFSKPRHMTIACACKAVQLTLRNGICQYSALSFLQLSILVERRDNAVCVYRISKNALSLQERFDLQDQIPRLYSCFYGSIAWHEESLQSCADHLRRGFECGLSSGQVVIGFYCSIQYIAKQLHIGTNLKSLLKEIDYFLHLLEIYKSEVTKNYMLCFRETISMLIDKGECTSIEAKAHYGDLSDPDNKFQQAFFFHQALRSFWMGYGSRCKHFSEKCSPIFQQSGKLNALIVQFKYALILVEMLSKKNSFKSRMTVSEVIDTIKEAASRSDWNFTNKLRLVEAEFYALENEESQAIAAYDASIASARKSKFIHEEGLACEKAGFYHKRINDHQSAVKYFRQARECYEKWGSDMKVGIIQKELDCLMGT